MATLVFPTFIPSRLFPWTTRNTSSQMNRKMICLLTRVTVTVLLLTGVICDSSLLDCSLITPKNCQADLPAKCAINHLDTIKIQATKELSEKTMISYLNTTMDLATCVMNNAPDRNNLQSFGKDVLDVNKKLVSTVVKTKGTSRIPFSVQNLKGEVCTMDTASNQYNPWKIQLENVSVVIKLKQLPKNIYGSTAIAFMSYTKVADILKPSFFSTVTNTKETTIMSTVVSATFPKTVNTDPTKPVNFKLTHIAEKDPEAFLSCMDWETNTWDTCSLTWTSPTKSMCSCKILSTFVLISQIDPCKVNLTVQCAMDFLNQIQYNIPQNLPQKTVENYLTTITNLTNGVMNQSKQNSYGNTLMNVTKKLASALVNRGDTNNSISISLQTLEVRVCTVRAFVNLSVNPTLVTSSATMDINLNGIFKKNQAAVAFMSYTNMADILERSFNTFTDTKKTMMSTVVSATLPKTTYTELTKPVFTLKHIKELAPYNILSCMSWNESTWDEQYCHITETNSTHTVCSCKGLATVTLVMQTDPCMGFVIGPCAKNFLYQIPVYTPQELPQEMVNIFLNIIMNITTRVTLSVSDQNYLTSYGDIILNVTEQLVSTLVRKRDTYINISLSLQDLEVQVVMVKPNVSLSEIPQLSTRNTAVDFDLVEILKNNNGSAAVAFINYTNMTNILKPTLFNTVTSPVKTMMSTVVSVSLPKTANTILTKPVKVTFKHTNELDPEGILSCVYWNRSTWRKEDQWIIQTNRTHTVCSYSLLSAFALIMQTDPCRSDRLINTLIAVAIIVGLVFLSLSIVTFSLYSRNPVTNAALINLCLNLLLFHFLSLIKTLFLARIDSLQLRAVLAGVQWFFLMSVFVWMFIEAVLLYIFVKNLSNTGSIPEEVFSWKWLTGIGYLIPLGVLGMSGVRFPKGYVDDECWLNKDESFFIFAGPVLLTVTFNLVPYLIIITIFTLKHLKNEILQMSTSADKNLIKCLMLRSLTQFIILICYLILLYIPSKNGVLYRVFQFLNSQQGTFIFLVHCLFNQEVRQKYRNVMSAWCFPNNPEATSRSVRGPTEVSQDN